MKRTLFAIASLLLAAAALPAAGQKSDAPAGPAAFSRLKTLVGEWETDSQQTGKIHTSYEPIAGGTALVERESGDKMPVMMTVYHLDGDRLLLTHYCMAGNQPRMGALLRSGNRRARFPVSGRHQPGQPRRRTHAQRHVPADRRHPLPIGVGVL